MSSPPEPPPPEHAAWLRREDVLDRFEAAWEQTGGARLEEFLPPPGSEPRLPLLLELIKIDLERRWARGEEPHAEDYLRQFPELAGPCGLLRELLAAEVQVRRLHGRVPSAMELSERLLGKELLASLDSTIALRHAPPAPVPEPAVIAGVQRLGRYELRAAVGRGSFATVYRAWDPELRREVALKVPRAELLADPEWRERVLREGRSAARLRHPAIVTLHEAGVAGDTPYLVYDFITGPTLADALRQAGPTPQQAAGWVMRLAEALDYAHRCGVIHRDVKPANVMLDGDGQPLLADFGLARATEAGATLTREGDVLGTPAYMPPEQAAGRNRAVDGRSDVYSLGAVLYELLGGRPPFQGTASDVLRQVLHDDPPPPRKLRPGVPLDLETICLKAMAREPAGRYQTAAELADDLHRYLNHQSIRARRRGPLGRLALWCRRRPALAGTIAAAVVVVAAVAAVSFAQVVAERNRYRTERDHAEANLASSLVSEARARLQARDTGWWWEALDKLREAGQMDVPGRDKTELRELAIECMGSAYPCLRLQATWTGHDGPVTTVAFSPDGRLAASGSRDRTVRVWSVSDGECRAVLREHTAGVTGVAFHPDGRHLASCSFDGSVRLWDVGPLAQPGGAVPPPRIVTLGAGAVRGLAFSADRVFLAAACADGTVRVLLAAGDGVPPPPLILRGHKDAVTCVAFSPTEPRLASGGEDRTIRFWSLNLGVPTPPWNLDNVPRTLAFQEDGGSLAWADQEAFGHFNVRGLLNNARWEANVHAAAVTQVAVWPGRGWWLSASADGSLKVGTSGFRNTWRDLAVARGDWGAVLGAAITSDGGRVAAAYYDGRVRLWEMAEPPQRALAWNNCQNAVFVGGERRLVGHVVHDFAGGLGAPWKRYGPAPVRALAAHPGGRLLAFGGEDGTLHLWDLQQRRELTHWDGHSRSVTALAGSPDGKRLASASADGAVKLWDWETGRLERALAPGVGAVAQVAWSRDGRHLAAAGERGCALWELAPGAAPRPPRVLSRLARRLAFGSDTLALGGADGAVDLVDPQSGQKRQTLRGHTEAVAVLEFAADGRQLASSAGDGTVRLWDTTTGTELAVFRYTGLSPTWLAFDPKGRYLAANKPPLVWDLRSKAAVAALYGGDVTAVRFLPDGSGLLLGDNAGAVRLCTVAEIEKAVAGGAVPVGGKALADPVRLDPLTVVVPGGHVHAVWGVAASPDGRWVATASNDKTVKLWDARTLQVVRTLQGHNGLVWCVAFSPDSRYLASGSTEVKVWEVATGRQVHDFQGHTQMVWSVAFHPSRPWLASSSNDGSVRLWDLDTGKPLGVLHQFEQPVHGVAFRPDGGRLAVACHDHRIALWDTSKWPALPTAPDQLLTGHTGAVWSVGFSADGRYLASGSEQGVIILWDGDSFDRVVTLRGGTGPLRSVCFSRDGQLLAGAAYTANTIVWDLAAVHRSLAEMNLDW
jgi:WD40 repeat protein/tRNA A-37 threonylcarbamoyl transferase component Bud32